MGGRFSSLEQKLSGNYIILYPQLNDDQEKKGFRQKVKRFSPKSGEDQKKKALNRNLGLQYIRPGFVGFIHAGWLLFVSSSSAQIPMGGRLNLDGGC